jgi:mannose-6-phosphate isomerase-like protein (cupin superfamily)
MTGFENCVVLKPWGHEFQVFDNGRASVWMLCIKPGQGTSVHCHFGKTARFVPLVGTAIVRTNVEVHRLMFPDSVAVDRYEFHAVGNGGDTDLWLIEIERPSQKADLFRLRDNYGRGQGYEGGDSIVRDGLDKFGYFSLSPAGLICGQFGRRMTVSRDDLMLHIDKKAYPLFGADCVTEAA